MTISRQDSPYSVTEDGRIACSDRQLTHLVNDWVGQEAARRFRQAVVEWAASNDTLLVTPVAVRREVAREALLVLEALGMWARVRGHVVFPDSGGFDFLSGESLWHSD